jgi:DNA-binding Lrp family transcriptional regulator
MKRAAPPADMHETVALDDFGLRLLACLQEDGRLTNQQVGERVGLSASQCSRRRIALEEAGLIRGYGARLDAEALGFRVVAFIQVTLSRPTEDAARRFAELLDRVDVVQEAYTTTGESDYLIKAVLPDLRELSSFLNEILLPHGSVAQVRSSLVLERLKETGRLPLMALRHRRR